MKPTPSDWPRMSSGVFYQDAKSAIDWLCRAFGFEVRLKVDGPDGRILHSELTYGGGVVMVGEESAPNEPLPAKQMSRSPRSAGGANTQSIMVYVDDADAHCAHARRAGAQIVKEPETTDYGPEYWADRSYGAIDLEGHRWWFAQRVR